MSKLETLGAILMWTLIGMGVLGLTLDFKRGLCFLTDLFQGMVRVTEAYGRAFSNAFAELDRLIKRAAGRQDRPYKVTMRAETKRLSLEERALEVVKYRFILAMSKLGPDDSSQEIFDRLERDTELALVSPKELFPKSPFSSFETDTIVR